MESTLNFGPQWLRTLSDSGTSGPPLSDAPSTPPVATSFGPPQYKLAEHRYGREEMLALYTTASSIVPDLSDTSIMLSKPLGPLSLEVMSAEEQTLLLSSVNSTLAVKAYGGRSGPQSRGGGRGEIDRGRGRGRGREEESYGRRRDPWEDGFSRGGGKSYDRGVGYQNSSGSSHNFDGPPLVTSHREYSRSMSTDNWRDAKFAAPPPDGERDVPRGNGIHGRGTTRNWREPIDRRSNDYDVGKSKHPPDGSMGQTIEFKRSQSSNSTHEEDSGHDALPEWSTVDAEELEVGGSFDASGAFLFSKDVSNVKNSSVNENFNKKSTVANGDKNGHFGNTNKKNVSSNRSTSLSSGQGDSVQLTDSVEQGLSSLSLAANAAVPYNHGNSRTVDQSGGFIDSQFSSNGPFSSPRDSCDSSGGTVLPVTNTVDSQAKSVLGLTSSDSVLKKEAESFVAQWTGGDEPVVKAMPGYSGIQQRHAVPLQHQALAQSTPPVLCNDQWFYRDPQGDIQGPFKNSEMAEWFTAGYFTMNLLVRSGNEGDFTSLGDLIKLCGEIPFVSKLPSGLPVAVNHVPTPTAIQPSATPTFNQIPEQLQLQMLQEQQQMQLLLGHQMRQYYAQQQLAAAAAAANGCLPGPDSLINPALSMGPMIGNPAVFNHLLQQNLLADGALAGPVSSSASSAAVTTSTSVNEPVTSKSINPWGVESKFSTVHGEDIQAMAAARERAEKERLEKEITERLRLEREHVDREQKMEQERMERERIEKERIEVEKQQWRKLQELKQLEEERRQKEQREMERQRQELERQRIEEERQKQESLRLKKKEEERLQQEQWLRMEEKLKREAAAADERREKQRIEEARTRQAKPAPWSVNQPGVGISSNLEHIQQMEAENQRQQQEELKRHKMMELQIQQQMQHQMQQQSLSWKERTQPTSKPTPSLLEIQMEQEKQIKEEKTFQQSHQSKSAVPEATFGSAAVWTASSGTSNNCSIWDNVDSGKRISVPATPLNSAAQFPALPAAAKKSNQASKPSKAAVKTQKEEVVVQKLFEANKGRDELTQWCVNVLHGLETSADIPTLVELLKDIESPYEVHDYICMYLGDSKQVLTFAQQFLEKRSKIKNASKPKQEDTLWGPAPALNPQLSRQQQTVTKQQVKQQPHQTEKSKTGGGSSAAASAAGGGGKKKKKMLKVDSSILGFTVHADSERTNMGEIDRV